MHYLDKIILIRYKFHMQNNPAPSPLPGASAIPAYRRPRGWTVDKQQEFLMMLALNGSVSRAAEHVGLSASSVYRLRARPEAEVFREGWAQAMQVCVAGMRDVALDRAINGGTTTIYKYGEIVARRTVPSDRMLMFVLGKYDISVFDTKTNIMTHGSDREPAAMAALVALTERLVRINDGSDEENVDSV